MRTWMIAGAGLLTVSLGAGFAIAQQEHGPAAGEGWRARMIDRFVERLDTDGDGALSAEEIAAARQPLLARLDSDGSGGLSRAEFVDGIVAGMTERLGERFDRLDRDGDGQLSAEEFERAQAWQQARHHRAGHGPGDHGWQRGPRQD